MLPLVAFAGAFLTAGLIYLFSSSRTGGLNPVRLVLVGVGFSLALSGAMIVVISSAERVKVDFIAKWLAGNIWGTDWPFIWGLLPWLIVFIPYALYKANTLNLLALDESVAVGSGVSITKERIWLLVSSVALSASAVSVTGGIAFIGLMAPHIARALVGARHQLFIPVAILMGGFLLLIADTIGRNIAEPDGIPAGILVSLHRGPVLCVLIVENEIGDEGMDAQAIFDVTIIGGGPAGLYSAFYSGLREMKTKIIEFQPVLGGKVNVYPEKMIWDIGGVTPLSGEQFIQQMIAQGRTFDPDIVLGEKVLSMKKTEDGVFVLQTSSGQEHYSRTVILAIGSGILNPVKLTLEGAERYEVSNLHYTVKSLRLFKDKTVLISGGGNAAVDWANELEPIAKKVYLTYRKEALKGHEAEVSKLMGSSVVCLLNTSIERLIASPDREGIDVVVLRDGDDGAITELAVDEVLINHGFQLDKDLLQNSEVRIEMSSEWGIAGTPMSETSVPGLYAAGDILSHDGKLQLIAGAFQDAANAVNKAKTYISPDARAHGMVSSHNDVFAERNRELKKALFTRSE